MSRSAPSQTERGRVWALTNLSQTKWSLILTNPRNHVRDHAYLLRGLPLPSNASLRVLEINFLESEIKHIFWGLGDHARDLRVVVARNVYKGDVIDNLQKIVEFCPHVDVIDIVSRESLDVAEAKQFFENFNRQLSWFDCSYENDEITKLEWRALLKSKVMKGIKFGPTLRTLFPMTDAFVQNMDEAWPRYYRI